MQDDPTRSSRKPLFEAAARVRLASTTHAYAQLEDAVCDFVDERRAAGKDVTHLLVELKQTLEDAGLTQRGGARMTSAIEHAVATCIAHFYKPAR